MRRVLHFPPIESFNTWVSLLCLNGTWSRRLSPSAMTACSKNVSDLLIYMASTCVSPSDSVFPSLSDPARSTKLSLEVTYFVLDSTREWDSIWTVKTQWERDDRLLRECWPIIRFVSPCQQNKQSYRLLLDTSSQSSHECKDHCAFATSLCTVQRHILLGGVGSCFVSNITSTVGMS